MNGIIRANTATNCIEASGKSTNLLILPLICGLLSTFGHTAGAAELLTLSPENYDRYAPQGNEVDAIFGDYVLRNDRITVVVANPDLVTGRSSSRWSIAHVAGCVIDIARNNHHGEALTAFYPGVTRYKPDAPQRQQDFIQPESFSKRADRKAISAKQVVLTIPEIELGTRRSLKDLAKLPSSQRGAPSPTIRVRYTLVDGWDAVKIETIYRNPSTASFKWQPHFVLRVDPASDAGNGIIRTVTDQAESPEGESPHFCWSYDRWFRQACGVLTLFSGIDSNLATPRQIRGDGRQITLLPGGEFRVTRWLIPGCDVFAIKGIANKLLQRDSQTVRLLVSNGESVVPNVFVKAKLGEFDYASGWTDHNGTLEMALPVLANQASEHWTLNIEPPGVSPTSVKLSPNRKRT